MVDPKVHLRKLTAAKLQEILDSTVNFQRTEKKLSNNSFVNFWKALRVLSLAVLGEKKGENVINPAFASKVEDILSKPHEELVKMK